MLHIQLFTTNEIRYLKCYNDFTTKVKTFVTTLNVKTFVVVRVTAHQDQFTHYEPSRLSGAKMGYHSFNFLIKPN